MKEIAEYIINNYNAGPKAKTDIEKILQKEYNCKINVFNLSNKNNTVCGKVIKKIKKMFFYVKNLFGDDLTVIQMPIGNFGCSLYNKKRNKIAIIHDIEGIRNQNEIILKKEIDFYNSCKAIIVHNEIMENLLIQYGVKAKIEIIGLFDYLVNDEKSQYNEANIENLKIDYAGNLRKEKTPFLYQIDPNKIKYEFNVYGVGIEKDINDKIKYKGSFMPDEIPNRLEGDLGLIWDGNLDESDENESYKNYTKYNNPHKLSCYIAAGIPVIVWEKAAIAGFVKKHNIGYTIHNIYDINNIDFNDYDEKAKNIIKICQKVREGYFIKNVFDKILNNDQQGEEKDEI